MFVRYRVGSEYAGIEERLDQATKEIKQRFDFKNSKTDISLKKKKRSGCPVGRRVQVEGSARYHQGEMREARRFVESV
jgi:hypothetical protein